MDDAFKCPLSLDKKEVLMTISQMKQIEDHILTANSCSHPFQLKDITFSGSLGGSTPLIMACHHGEFDSVKHIVENWGVDVNTAATYRISPEITPFTCVCGGRCHEFDVIRATPLFVAACHGQYEIVRYLVKNGADVSARISSEDDPFKFSGWTPLYGAFCNLRISPQSNMSLAEKRQVRNDIIRFLLESGADPSKSFKTYNDDEIVHLIRESKPNSSIAKYKQNLNVDTSAIKYGVRVASAIELVKRTTHPIWLKTLCSVDATTALINHGLDLKQKGENGTSILHYWANVPDEEITEEDSLMVVKLLLNKGTDLLAQDDLGLEPIISAAGGYMYYSGFTSPNATVLDFLLERDEISREDKIDALELAGACCIDESQFESGFQCWRRALHLRLMVTEGSGPILKSPLNQKVGRAIEWTTLDQLERVFENPSEHGVQSALLQLRFFSGKRSEIFQRYVCWKMLGGIIKKLEGEGKLIEKLDIIWATLEAISRLGPNKVHWKTTRHLARDLKETLSILENQSPELFTNFETYKISWDLVSCSFLKLEENCETFISLCMEVIIFFVGKIESLPSMLSEEIMEVVLDWLRHDRRGNNGHGNHDQTFLHTAIWITSNRELIANTSNTDHPILKAVRFLLQSGADVSACDGDGDPPLHYLAKFNQEASHESNSPFVRRNHQVNQQLLDSIAGLLLDFGAHLDRTNKKGQTAADVWNEFNEKEQENAKRWNIEPRVWVDLPNWLRETVPKLSCLSAKMILYYKIPYLEHNLPDSLYAFIKMH